MSRVAAILCLISLAGCGSASTASQFESGYAAARAPLNRTFREVATLIGAQHGKSAAEVAASVSDLAARFDTELAPLVALTPPPAARTAFTTLTSSLTRVTRDLRDVSTTAKNGDLAGAQLAVERLESDARSASMAASAVKQKLYTR